MSVEQTQDNNPEVNHVKDMIDSLSTGDNIELTIPEPKFASLKPYKFKLNIIYEDEDLIVLNKPAGIVMHPGAGNLDNTIVNALMNYDKDCLSNIGDQLRPGSVHRIDKNTSGLVVISKNNQNTKQVSKHTKIKNNNTCQNISKLQATLLWKHVHFIINSRDN